MRANPKVFEASGRSLCNDVDKTLSHIRDEVDAVRQNLQKVRAVQAAHDAQRLAVEAEEHEEKNRIQSSGHDAIGDRRQERELAEAQHAQALDVAAEAHLRAMTRAKAEIEEGRRLKAQRREERLAALRNLPFDSPLRRESEPEATRQITAQDAIAHDLEDIQRDKIPPRS